MFGLPSLRLGRLFGIPIEVNVSWIAIFVLATTSLATGYFPDIRQAAGAPSWVYILVSAATTVLFFLSIVVHELCHALVARSQGGGVDRITLFIFGGVAQIEDEPTSAGREFLMASAGPFASLMLAVLGFILYVVTRQQGLPWWIWAPLDYLAWINLAVAIFNLLPGFPLDGGRVLRSILWGLTGNILTATRWAVRVGQAIGWFMVAAAVLDLVQGRTRLLWFGLIGWFIAFLAGRALRQQEFKSAMEGRTVRGAMTPGPEYVRGEESVEDFVHEHLLTRRHSRYPVLIDGQIAGLISLPDVKAVDRREWPLITVADVANRDMKELVVQADAPVSSVLSRLAGDRPGALLVVDAGHLAGIMTRADLLDMLDETGLAGPA